MDNKPYFESFGAIISPIDVRDYQLNPSVCMSQHFPDTFRLDMGSVKDQGCVGSCVAHSLAEIIEFHDHRQNQSTVKMSTGFIYGNRRNTAYKGVGMVVREAIKSIHNDGDCFLMDFKDNVEVPNAIDLFENRYDELQESAYPNRISGYYKVSTANEIKTALMKDGPVLFVINWYDDIKLDKNYIVRSNYSKYSGSHCMVIYGWNENGWLIQNSWGFFWGNKGTAILPYDFPMNEAWGITDDITGDDIHRPFNTKFGRFISKIFNNILNFIRKIFKRC